MKNLFPIFLILSLMLFTGWGKKQAGESIPSNLPVTKLKDIAQNLQAYKDQEVVLDGNYGFYCCPDDFSYKEGLESVNISPSGFESPKGKLGQPVMIFGIVRMGKSDSLEREEEAGEGHHDYYIEGKGVEFK